MKRLLQQILLLSLVMSSLNNVAFARVITTEAALAIQQHEDSIERVGRFLMREDVQAALVRMGVDQSQAIERVQALTPSELAQLERHLNELPAGGTGIVEVLGIVVIVLIVLELLGVTNVFTRF
ncbi:MAG: hypothetical protein E2O61_04395 [Gammaproteobacteria bacterium]|nr:PA2779 family protein [Pseudomonadota bacterium]TDJ38421.1 MAG: hypothetical protein E2O61_04395 [Gammaproteobacteria bacterium]